MINQLFCCYFPTKVVFVDDNKSFLKSMRPLLDDNIASYDFFDNPYNALDFVNGIQGIDFLPSAFPARPHIDEELYKAIYSSRRYEEVSTVIVDYEMPGIKGLEFCKKLANPYIRKILYTGVADETMAIEAFNNGIIDGYIRKKGPDQDVLVREFVIMSQLRYFKALSDVSIEVLLKKDIVYDNHRDAPFYDPMFIKYFNELIKKNNISEYYFNDYIGGFVFLTSQGKTSALYTLGSEIFDDVQSEFIITLKKEDTKNKRLALLVKELEQERKTICLPFQGNNQHPDARNWEEYAYPLDIVQGKNTYYVAYVPEVNYINSPDIFSFERYQRDR